MYKEQQLSLSLAKLEGCIAENSSDSLLDHIRLASSDAIQAVHENVKSVLLESSSVYRYLTVMVDLFGSRDASVRMLVEQNFDTIIKKLVLNRQEKYAIQIVIVKIEHSSSTKTISILLSKLNYLLSFTQKCNSNNLRDFDRTVKILLKAWVLAEKDDNESLYTFFEHHFDAMMRKMPWTPSLMKEIKEIAVSRWSLATSTPARSLATVLLTIAELDDVYIEEIYETALEYVIKCYEDGVKPGVAPLMCLKKLVRLLDPDKNIANFKRTIEISLLLLTSRFNEISFQAFAVLEDVIATISRYSSSFVPGNFLDSERRGSEADKPNASCSTVVSSDESDQESEQIIDPLLHPTLYDKSQELSQKMTVPVDFSLPSYDLISKDEIVNVYRYIAGFLCKKYLLTGVKGTVKTNSESRDSKKILAINCLIGIAKVENIANIDIVFDSRTQCITDVVEFLSHNDESLVCKTIVLLSYFLAHMKPDENIILHFENILKHSESLRQRILLESFSDHRVRYICKSKLYRSFVIAAEEMCKSENAQYQNCGTLFISNLRQYDEEHSKWVPFLEKHFLSVLKDGSLPQTSNYCEHLKRLYGLSDIHSNFPPTKLDLVVNSNLMINVNAISNCEESLYWHVVNVLKEMFYSDTSTLANMIMICQHLIEEYQFNLEMMFPVENIISYLNYGAYKKHVVVALMKVLTATCRGRCIDNIMNESLRDCGDVAHRVLLVGLKSLRLVLDVIYEYEKTNGVVETIWSHSQSTNKDKVIREKTNFEDCTSLREIRQDVLGAYNNFRSSLNLATDEKFLELAETSAELCATALEFTQFEDLHFLNELILFSQKLLNVAPSAALKLVHQLMKLIFKNNMIHTKKQQLMNDCHYGEHLFQKPIQDLLTEISTNNSKLIKESMGYMFLKPKPVDNNEEMMNLLSEFEGIITIMIQVFRNRGMAEKREIILVMIDLLRAGIVYEQADPKRVVMNEILSCIDSPNNSTHPELLEIMVQFIVIENRNRENTGSLNNYLRSIVKSFHLMKKNDLKFAINASNIILCEMFEKKIDVYHVCVESSSQHLETCLDIAPEETCYHWFLIISSHKNSSEMQNYSNIFLGAFCKWVPKCFKSLNIINILLPLGLIEPSTFLNHLELIHDSLEHFHFPLKSGALLSGLVHKVQYSVLKERLEKFEKNPDDWLKRMFEKSLTENYNGKDKVEELYKLHIENVTSKSSSQTDVARTDSLFELKHRNSRAISELCTENVKTENVILALSQSPTHIHFGAKTFVESDISTQINVVEIMDQHSQVASFWKYVMDEYRFQILKNDEESVNGALFLREKLQRLVEWAIEKRRENEKSTSLLQIMAHLRDIKVDLHLMTIQDIEKTVMSFLDAHGTTASCQSIQTILADSSISHIIKTHSWLSLDFHFKLLHHLVEQNESTNYQLCEMFKKFNIQIDEDDDKKKTLIGSQLSSCFVASQQLMNRENVQSSQLDLISRVLRHPLIYPMFFISQAAVKSGWIPTVHVKRDGKLDVSLPQPYLMCSIDVLKDMEQKLLLVGWLEKSQFENICASLLGVLATTPTGNEAVDESNCVDLHRRYDYASEAIDLFSLTLLQTLKFPKNGDPVSKYILKSRENNDPYFSSKDATQLSISMCTENGIPKHALNKNIERLSQTDGNGTTTRYSVGQMSVLSLWTICGLVPQENKQNGFQNLNMRPSLSQHLFNSASDIDTISNVRSLVDIFSHLNSHGIAEFPHFMLMSIARSLLYLSDFFDDIVTYDFMCDLAMRMHNHSLCDSELDDLIRCIYFKSIAVLGIEQIQPNVDIDEKKKLIVKWIKSGTRCEANPKLFFGALSYLLQAFSIDSMDAIVLQIAEFVVSFINSNCFYFRDNMNEFLAVAVQITKLPNTAEIGVKLSTSLFELLADLKYHRHNYEAIAETHIQLICHSEIYVEPIAEKIEKTLASEFSRLTAPHSVCLYKVLMAAGYKSSSPDMNQRLLKIILELSLQRSIKYSRMVLRSLPNLLVRLSDLAHVVRDLLKKVYEEEDYSVISFYLTMISELYNISKNKKSWMKSLNDTKDRIESDLISLKTKSLVVYKTARLAIEQPLRVASFLPLNYNSALEMSSLD